MLMDIGYWLKVIEGKRGFLGSPWLQIGKILIRSTVYKQYLV